MCFYSVCMDKLVICAPTVRPPPILSPLPLTFCPPTNFAHTHKLSPAIWYSWRPKAAGPIPRAGGEGPYSLHRVYQRMCSPPPGLKPAPACCIGDLWLIYFSCTRPDGLHPVWTARSAAEDCKVLRVVFFELFRPVQNLNVNACCLHPKPCRGVCHEDFIRGTQVENASLQQIEFLSFSSIRETTQQVVSAKQYDLSKKLSYCAGFIMHGNQ